MQIRAQCRAAWRRGGDARQEESQLGNELGAKDLFYICSKISDQSGLGALRLLFALSPVDGGIAPAAQPEFNRWAAAIVDCLKKHSRENPHGTPLDQLAAVLDDEEVARAHLFYLRARNWAELDDSQVQFPWDRDDHLYALTLFLRHNRMRTLADAEAIYQGLLNVFGQQSVDHAVQLLRKAPRTPDRQLANPGAIGAEDSQEDEAFIEVMGSGDTRSFLLHMIADEMERAWNRVPAIYGQWTFAYGSEPVLKVAEYLRGRKLDNEGKLADPVQFGDVRARFHLWRYEALRELLAKSNPRGFVRSLLAFHNDCQTREQVDALYADLCAKYTEQKVMAAEADLMRFWEPYSNQLQAETAKRRNVISIRTLSKPNDLSRATRDDERDYLLLMDVLANGSQAALGDLTLRKQVENPYYRLWTKFKPGATVVYKSTSATQDFGRTLQIDPLSYEEIYKFASVTDESLVLHFTEQGTRESRGPRGAISRQRLPARPREELITARVNESDALAMGKPGYLTFLEWGHAPPAEPWTQGKATLKVGGQTFQCDTYRTVIQRKDKISPSRVTQTIWLCDDIPGRLAKQLTVTEYLSQGKVQRIFEQDEELIRMKAELSQ